MPYINLNTTVEITDDKKKLLTESFGSAIELIPGKSEEWLMLNFVGGAAMAFKGSFEDCAMIEVEIFGKASGESYDALTEALCNTVSEALGVNKNRIYVKYEEIDNWGWNGMNF